MSKRREELRKKVARGQARARGDEQSIGRGPGIQVACANRLCFPRARRIDEESGQNPGDPRQFKRRFGLLAPIERLGLERAFQRIGKVQRGIGDRQRGAQIEGLRPADQHGRVRCGRLALVGKLQRGGARGADQHLGRIGRARHRGFHRQQHRAAFQRQRPAMAQGVHRLRHAALG